MAEEEDQQVQDLTDLASHEELTQAEGRPVTRDVRPNSREGEAPAEKMSNAKVAPYVEETTDVISPQKFEQEVTKTEPALEEDAMNLQFEAVHDNYNPWASPPDFAMARKHARAKRVTNLAERLQDDEVEDDSEICPCCNFPYESQPFSVWKTGPMTLGELGCGFSLYFDLVKDMIIIMLVCFAFAFYAIYTNYDADHEGDYDTELEENNHYMISGSIAAWGTDDEPPVLQTWLNAVMCWTVLFIYVIVHLRHKSIVRRIDQGLISPSDFTLFVRNIPTDTKEEELQQWLEEKSLPSGPAKIVKINLTYDIDEFVDLQDKYEYWRQKLNHAPDVAKFLQKDKAYCENKVRDIGETLKVMEAHIENSPFCGKAFVTYLHEREAKIAKHYLTRPLTLTTWWTKLKHLIGLNQPKTRERFRGVKLLVRRPDEPNDVLWENLGEKGALKRRIITYIATLLVLVAAAGVIYGSSFWKKSLKDDQSENPTTAETTRLTFLGLVPAIIISIINIGLTKTIRYFGQLEKYDTNTAYQTSVAFKLTMAMFINTAIVALIVYNDEDDWYGLDSLIGEVQSIVIVNAALGPLLYFFSPWYAYKKFKQWWEMRKGARSKLTQQQAHTLFEGPKVDLAARCSYLMKTYLVCMFYGPILPMAYPITMLSFVLEYWVDKFILFNRHVRPDAMGKHLDRFIIRFIPIGVVLNCASTFIFHYQYNSDALIPCIVGIVISFAFLITPWIRFQKFQKLLKKTKLIIEEIKAATDMEKKDKNYKDYNIDFVDDYDRENPITCDDAQDAWIKDIEEAQGSEEAGIVSAYMHAGEKHGLADKITGKTGRQRRGHAGGRTQSLSRDEGAKKPSKRQRNRQFKQMRRDAKKRTEARKAASP